MLSEGLSVDNYFIHVISSFSIFVYCSQVLNRWQIVMKKRASDGHRLLEPWQKYLGLSKFSRRVASMFGSMYMCECTFSIIKVVKLSQRNRLINLQDLFKILTTSWKIYIGDLLLRMSAHRVLINLLFNFNNTNILLENEFKIVFWITYLYNLAYGLLVLSVKCFF